VPYLTARDLNRGEIVVWQVLTFGDPSSAACAITPALQGVKLPEKFVRASRARKGCETLRRRRE
jgi:hypothetical protein